MSQNQRIRAVDEFERNIRKRKLFYWSDSRYPQVARMKKATIVVKMVSESSGVSDSRIVKEILAEAKIPWVANIERVTINANL